MTRTFCIGSMEHLRKLGLPNVTLPAGGREPVAPETGDARRNEVPAEAAPPDTSVRPTPEPAVVEAPLPAGLSEDMQTLQAVLSMDLSQIPDLPIEDLEVWDDDSVEIAPQDPGTAEARLAALLPDAEMLTNGRRRRRRGGRGRGRRRSEGTGDHPAGEPGGEPVSAESGLVTESALASPEAAVTPPASPEPALHPEPKEESTRASSGFGEAGAGYRNEESAETGAAPAVSEESDGAMQVAAGEETAPGAPYLRGSEGVDGNVEATSAAVSDPDKIPGEARSETSGQEG